MNVSWYQRILQKIARYKLVTDFFSTRIQKIDKMVMKASHGRTTASQSLVALPTIWVTTIGAKTGNKYTIPLAGFPDDERYFLVASNFGRPYLPNWYYNMTKTPRVIVQNNGFEQSYIAEEVSGDDYQRYWIQAVDHYPGFADYKVRAAGREIPIIRLSPDQS